MEKHAEILAPAGGEAQLRAAVLCGADAVYLGLRGFNARAGAENFDENTLPQTVGWCHARGVRVYVTLNTLVTDRELPQWIWAWLKSSGSGTPPCRCTPAPK